MKIITLTHNVSGKDVLINWDNILFVAETENNFGEQYTEVAFEQQGAIPVKQTITEISSLLKDAE
jgi:hypothetical protein